MRALRFVIPLVLYGLAVSPAHAWGPLGHRIVNARAVEILPDPLRKIMRPHDRFTFLQDHAMDPDLYREVDREEPMRHFIYLDRYAKGGADPYQMIPMSLREAEKKFGKQTLRENGLLPWVIENRFNTLVQAFKEKNATKIWSTAAWLGHYVADAHVPHHTIVTEETAPLRAIGPLARWEHTLIDKYVKPADIDPEPPMILMRRPQELARQWTLESYRLAAAMLNADREASRGSETDYETLARLTLPAARQRLTQATHRVASMWFTAWEKAGRPTNIAGMPDQVQIFDAG